MLRAYLILTGYKEIFYQQLLSMLFAYDILIHSNNDLKVQWIAAFLEDECLSNCANIPIHALYKEFRIYQVSMLRG